MNARAERWTAIPQAMSPTDHLLSPRWDDYDQHRQASMSDEGGNAAALIENQDRLIPSELDQLQHGQVSAESANLHQSFLIQGLWAILFAAFAVSLFFFKPTILE